MKTHMLVILIALCLSSDSAFGAAPKVESLIRLTPGYRIASMQQMPRLLSTPGLKAEQRVYLDFDAVEWQMRLAGPVDRVGAMVDALPSIDCHIDFPAPSDGGEVGGMVLRWNKGSHAEATDFKPIEQLLGVGESVEVTSFGGRSSDGALPYFNLSTREGGIITAIGWPGDWKIQFTRISDRSVAVRGGLKRAHFRIPQKEVLRLPSVVLMPWKGDWLIGQNTFRRLLRTHFSPHGHSLPELMPVAASIHGMVGFNDTTEAKLLEFTERVAKANLPIDTIWLDAGWNRSGFPQGQGNPNPDPQRFSAGLKAVGDAVHKTDRRFLVWFEPERVMKGTELAEQHSSWLLSPSGTPDDLKYQEKDGFLLLDFGNAEARNWMLDLVSKQIKEYGVNIYRQDFNLYPAWFWHTGEGADENGLHELRYNNGLLTFWDELLKRHPGLVIDNCASGGRRLDFESLRRSVCLWRSDSCWGDPEYPRNVQAMTHGLSHWIPLHGLGAASADQIALRSGMGACGSFAINYEDPQSIEQLRKHLNLYLPLRGLFAEDFYPLTAWSTDPTQWLAFQFHQPSGGVSENGEARKERGLVQAFCGPQPAANMQVIKLQGLDENGSYRVRNWDDSSEPQVMTGKTLLTEGLQVSAQGGAQTAIVIEYERQMDE